jgi:hypothetical protein
MLQGELELARLCVFMVEDVKYQFQLFTKLAAEANNAMVLTLTPIINQIQLTPAAMLRTTMLARVSRCGNRWVALL